MEDYLDIVEYPGPTSSASAPILHNSASRSSNLTSYQHRNTHQKNLVQSQSSLFNKTQRSGTVIEDPELDGWRCWKWCGMNTLIQRRTLIVGVLHFSVMIGFIVFGVGMWISRSNALYGLWVFGGLLGGPTVVALFCGLRRKQRLLYVPFMIFQGFGLIVLSVFLLMCISLLVELGGRNESSGIQKTFGIDPLDTVPHQIAFASCYLTLMLFILGAEIWSLVIVRRCYRHLKTTTGESSALVGDKKPISYH